MPIARSSEEAYSHFVTNSTDSWLFGLVSFAVFEEQKIEWIEHRIKEDGAKPAEAEVTKWYAEQPDGMFLRVKGTAENALQNFSSDVVAEELKSKIDEIRGEVVVQEIRRGTNNWKKVSE